MRRSLRVERSSSMRPLLSMTLLAALVAPSSAPAATASHPAAPSPRRHLAPSPTIQALVPTPATVLLNGPYAEARVLVEARLAGGERRDASARVAWKVADPTVAEVDALG